MSKAAIIFEEIVEEMDDWIETLPTMKRQLTDHKTNGCNEQLAIEVIDEPGAGGAHHLYQITGFSSETNACDHLGDGEGPADELSILFQNGPVKEVGVNGVTQEALLAILIDRMRGFDSGPYRCRENACALTHLEEALHWLHSRTRSRLAQGIEGTMEKREGVEG